MVVVVAVVAAGVLAISPPSLPSLLSPNTYILNGYSVPGDVWAPVTQHARLVQPLMELTRQWKKELNKETNEIISESEKSWKENKREL